MNEKRLIALLDELSSIMSIDEEQRVRFIEGYKNLEVNQIVKALAMQVYLILGVESPHYEYALNIILDYFPEVNKTLDDVKEFLDKMFRNMNDNKMALKDNHAIVKELLVKCVKVFNELGIDYYIVGALPCFIKTGQPLYRYHDDIDIMVNEDDMSLVQEAVNRLGLEFHDDRFPTRERFDEMQDERPPHTVLAQCLDNEFHLGFFCFRRENDNTITVREYMHRLVDEEVVVDVRERVSTKFGTSLRYEEEETVYEGVGFRTCAPEYVYFLKIYTQTPKDLADMRKLAPYIDKDKLMLLGQNKGETFILEDVSKQYLNK